MPINITGIITLLVAFLNIFLGFLVLIKNPRRTNNIVYAISVSSISLWSVFTYLYNNPTLLSAENWLIAVYISSYGMLFAQMLFAYHFPKKVKSNFLIYAIPVFLTLLPSIYVLIIKQSVVVSAIHIEEDFLSIATLGQGYLMYTLTNVLGLLLLTVYFLRKSSKFVGYEKAQIQFYVLGALLMMVPIVILDYLLPLLTGNTRYFVYGPLFGIPFSIAVSYSILQKRFITIKSLVRKVVFLILEIFYIGISFFCVYWILGFFDTNKWFYILLLGVFLFAFYKLILRGFLIRFANLFEKRAKDMEASFENFIKINNIELTVDRIFINTKRTIEKMFEIENVGLVIFEKNNYSIRQENLDDFQDINSKQLISFLRYWEDISQEKFIITDEIKRERLLNYKAEDRRFDRVVDFMDKNNISTIILFNSRTQFNGMLLLGYRRDKYPLAVEDIGVLGRLESNLSLSIGRALLYQEVQDFNDTLRKKVNEQTQELQIKIKELEEARRKERDMIDIMGHELRTPATVVKLNIELLEKKLEDEGNDFSNYINRIKRAVENEIELINTLLSSAKLEGDKVEIKSVKVDLQEEIEMSMHGYELEAEEKDLDLISKVEKDLPLVYADRARVMEVLNNLISNAIKYTEKGSVTVRGERDGDYVKVSVKDTGKGIPKEELKRLGSKFHRVENYIEDGQGLDIVRPGGTGLGLYVVFNLVRLMGGEINVESELRKGSTFSFTLPIYKGQKESNVSEDSKNMFEKLGLDE